jgi:hypothetical protein
MKNFAKGATFFIFGVLLSPILLGMFAPLVVWEMTESPIAVVIAAVVSFSVWAMAREAMIARKWHCHL